MRMQRRDQRYKTPRGIEALKGQIALIEDQIRKLSGEASDAELNPNGDECEPGLSCMLGDAGVLQRRLREKKEELSQSKVCSLPEDVLRQKALIGSYVICEECECAENGSLVVLGESFVHLVGWRESYREANIQGLSYTSPKGNALFRCVEGDETAFRDPKGKSYVLRVTKLCGRLDEVLELMKSPAVA